MNGLPIADLSRAVLIGASEFADLPGLPAVRSNLTDLADALANPLTGILPRDHCTIVSTPDSTATFMRQLRAVAKQAEDFLLVYYAGHGVRDQIRDDRLYLAVRETDPEGPDGTAVPFDSVRDVIEHSPARTRVLILDCCYSGLAVGAMSDSAVDIQEVAVGGTAVITSSPKNRRSLSPPGERNTAFTRELISLLTAGSPIPNEPLTVRTTFRSLQVALAARHLPEPKLKVTDTSSDVLLRRMPPPPKPAPIVIESEIRAISTALTVDIPDSKPPITAPVLTIASTHQPQAETAGQQKTSSTLARFLLASSGWTWMWICFCLGISFGVGGIVGTIAGNKSDLPMGIGMLILAGVLGIFLIRRRVRRRQSVNRPLRLQDVRPQVARHLVVPVTIFQAGIVSISITVAIMAILSPTGPNAGPSGFQDIGTKISLIIAAIELGWSGTYSLYKHWAPVVFKSRREVAGRIIGD